MDAATAHEWLDRLDGETDETLRRSRAVALLHARQPDVTLEAWRRACAGQPDMDQEAWMDLLGYALEEGGLRPLHDSRPLHISASAAQRRHMDASQPAWRREIRALHPTWKRFDGPGKDATAVQLAGMGGALPGTCGLCHGPLHRLLSLDQPACAGIACDGPLSFGVCLSCLGWEESALFYRHDAEGLPQAHPTQRKDVAIEPQFPPNRWRRPRSRCSRRPRAGPGRIGVTRTASRT